MLFIKDAGLEGIVGWVGSQTLTRTREPSPEFIKSAEGLLVFLRICVQGLDSLLVENDMQVPQHHLATVGIDLVQHVLGGEFLGLHHKGNVEVLEMA